jgi:3-hydroxyisobutyrate dehydrogenase-like beta-hydroxyacid dehydrogenase
VGSGSGDSAMRALKAESMVSGDFEALFKLEHMLKDVRYCIAEARKVGLDTSMARAAEKHYSDADDAGRGGEDFSAVIEAIRR